MSNPTDSLGYGPLQGLPTFVSNTNLSTTPTEVTPPTPRAPNPKGVKIKIVNGHASNVMGWALVRRGDAAPSITADYASATPCSIVLPGASEYFSLWWGDDDETPNLPTWQLYIVASATNTQYNITFDLIY